MIKSYSCILLLFCFRLHPSILCRAFSVCHRAPRFKIECYLRPAAGGWCKTSLLRLTTTPLCQCMVLLDLFVSGLLVLLPPALGAEALPGRVAIETTSLRTQQLWLVHMDPTTFRPVAHPSRLAWIRLGITGKWQDWMVERSTVRSRPTSNLMAIFYLSGLWQSWMPTHYGPHSGWGIW